MKNDGVLRNEKVLGFCVDEMILNRGERSERSGVNNERG